MKVNSCVPLECDSTICLIFLRDDNKFVGHLNHALDLLLPVVFTILHLLIRIVYDSHLQCIKINHGYFMEHFKGEVTFVKSSFSATQRV